jgi:hypothetical protein
VKYRKDVHRPQVLMASNRWGEIDFTRVPSLCLQRNRKALL